MPKSPDVNFDVTNNNIAATETQLGVGFVLARTTKGKFFDPSELIRTSSQFADKFGSEIVPDGTKSNILRALELGAIVRVCRIGHLNASGVVDAVKGTLVNGKEEGLIYVPDTGSNINLVLTGYEANPITIKLKMETREFGGDIFSVNGKFMNVFTLSGNTVISTIYSSNTKANLTSAFKVAQNNFVTTKAGTATTPMFVDTSVLKNFFNFDPYFETTLVSVLEGSTPSSTYITLSDVITLLNKAQKVNNTSLVVQNSIASPLTLTHAQPLYYLGTVGNAGTTPVVDDWNQGLEFTKDYNDYYDFFCSHIHQHLDSEGALAVHQKGGSVADLSQSATYNVEIPKTNLTKQTIIGYRDSVGLSSKHVAYFAGGLKLYDKNGTLQDTDVLGTVLGLSSNSATKFGPWYSFAGQNRGVVGDAHGPVAVNYGSPGNKDDLNSIAQASINIFVIKDIANGGKATLLWHNFTSTLSSDSERFLNVERLLYYIKKGLRPTLERYLEEPNTFATWGIIYLDIFPFMEDIQNRKGVSQWNWQGDQFATSFNDLQVNNERDVRQGKYKAILTIKEVVALQEINVNIVLDTSLGSINVEPVNQ